MPNTQFRIVHLSDLHFSRGADQSYPDHKHSIVHLRGIERVLQSIEYDRLIITGDVSNRGDAESLLRARQWIYSELEIGSGEKIGLRADLAKVRIIPGNHDAWDTDGTGTVLDRRQKSLKEYNKVFPENAIVPPAGCYYDWIEKNDAGLFIAFADSCYLGDPQLEGMVPDLKFFDRIAKGKLSIEVTERLLEWYDQGIHGNLPYPGDASHFISSGLFAGALKMLAMHHYIFEPADNADEYLMQIRQREVVFRNIALADFDILLCGHKHIPEFKPLTLGDQLDDRARFRYLTNYFRRIIGIPSMPIQYVDEKGRRFSKALSMFANILFSKTRSDGPIAPEHIERVIALLRGGLDDPDSLEREAKKLFGTHPELGAHRFSRAELEDIRKQISINLRPEERKRLKAIADKIFKVVSSLESRTFVQAMAGSACKAGSPVGRSKFRSFNVYEILPTESGFHLKSYQYAWDSQRNEFSPEPRVRDQSFDNVRRPHL